jgi:hypothetical protein
MIVLFQVMFLSHNISTKNRILTNKVELTNFAARFISLYDVLIHQEARYAVRSCFQQSSIDSSRLDLSLRRVLL